MGTTKVLAKWAGNGLSYVGTSATGHTITMSKETISPGQMLLLGFAGCMGMDVLHVLRKKRLTITDLEVEVIGHQPEQYPKPYEVVEIAFTVKGENISPQAVERAIALSRDTYCVVGQTLRNPVEIKTSYTVS